MVLPPLHAINHIGAEADNPQLQIQQYQQDTINTRRVTWLSLLNVRVNVVTDLAKSYLRQMQERVLLETGGSAQFGPDYMARTSLSAFEAIKGTNMAFGGIASYLDWLNRVVKRLKNCTKNIMQANQRNMMLLAQSQ